MKKLLIILCVVLSALMPINVFAETTAYYDMGSKSIILKFDSSAIGKEASVFMLYPSKTIDGITNQNILETVAYSIQKKIGAENTEVVAEIDGPTGNYTVYYDYEGCTAPNSLEVHYVNIEDNKKALELLNTAAAKKDEAGKPDEKAAIAEINTILTKYSDDLCFENEFEDSVELSKIAERMYPELLKKPLDTSDYLSAAAVYDRACLFEAAYKGADINYDKYKETLGLTVCQSYNWYNSYRSSEFNSQIKDRLVGKTISDTDDFRTLFDEAVVTSVVYMPNGSGNVKLIIEEFKTQIFGSSVVLTDNEAVYLGLSGGVYKTYGQLAEGYNKAITVGTVSGKPENSRPSNGGSGGSVGGMKIDTPPINSDMKDVSALYPNVNYDGTAGNYPDMAIVPWARPAVSELSARGIIVGDENGYFNPEKFVTREEFAKMLVMAFSIEDKGTDMSFSDVMPDDWFYPYVKAAYSNNIISGMGDYFGVGQNITRQDMAVMLVNAVSVSGQTLDTGELVYNDNAAIADYAVNAVSAVIKSGIMSDVGNGYFNPDGLVTRAHAAKAVYLAIK